MSAAETLASDIGCAHDDPLPWVEVGNGMHGAKLVAEDGETIVRVADRAIGGAVTHVAYRAICDAQAHGTPPVLTR